MKAKPDGWEEELNNLVVSGKTYKETNEALKEAFGEEGAVGGSTFRTHKKKLTGGPEVDGKLGELGEALKGQKEEKAKPQRPAWTKQKQTAADTSKLALIINKGMYHGLMPFCKNKALLEKDVQDVNFGGAVVGTVQHFVPGLNLDHPLVLLATRGIILYLKFKAICSKIEEMKGKIEDALTGIKPGLKTEEHKP